ncbi:hypothetical protein RQP46_005504 [Phenoliferia psychrophenolica]
MSNTTAPAATSEPSPIAPTSTPAKAKGSRRPKAIKRRGAKIEEDEGEEDSAKASVEEPTSDSDSDFSAGQEDSDEDEDASDEESAAPAPPTLDKQNGAPKVEEPAVASAPEAGPATAAPLGHSEHPSWADVPAGTEEELPTLDFSALTPSTLAQVPSRTATPIAPTTPGPTQVRATAPAPGQSATQSKKAQLLAKREAKFAALKASDPVAFEAQEQERRVRDLAKKREKKERKRLEKLATASSDPAVPTAEPTASASQPNARPAPRNGPVPSRPSRTAQSGLLPSSTPSTSNQTPSPYGTSTQQQPQQQRRGPPSGSYPAPEYVNAREAYSTRLATDPSYTPRIGRFWSHDDRLVSSDLRPLSSWGRGRARGGGEGMRGRGGRGGGRGGREGGYNPGWDHSNGGGEGEQQRGGQRPPATGWVQPSDRAGTNPSEEAEPALKEQGAQTDPVEPDEDDEDDGWGRGEAKRKLRPSFPPAAPGANPSWSHDGFDELVETEAHRPHRGAGSGRGRGNGRNASGPPGSINPAFAHVPFHPKHRFPVPPPPPEETMTSLPSSEQDTLFDKPDGPLVRLPRQVSIADATLAAQAANLTLETGSAPPAPDSRGVIVKLGGGGPVTVFPPSAEELSAEQEERRRGGASILYAADPERLPRLQEQQYQQPMTPQYFHQLPPHLQAQAAAAQQQQQFIPRHGSPAFYPQQFYSPSDAAAFPSMPTPGATPPPLFQHQGPASTFFAPPRGSRIEIKAPGPSHSPSNHKSNLSAAGDAFQPRATPAYVQQGSPANSSPSPQLAYAAQDQAYYDSGTAYYDPAYAQPGQYGQAYQDPAQMQFWHEQQHEQQQQQQQRYYQNPEYWPGY